jgi:hypothetical protein
MSGKTILILYAGGTACVQGQMGWRRATLLTQLDELTGSSGAPDGNHHSIRKIEPMIDSAEAEPAS